MGCSAGHIFWALLCFRIFCVLICSPKQRNPSGLIGSVTLETFLNLNILYSRKLWKGMSLIKKHLCCCAGIGWHEVNFLHSSCCLFCICDPKSIDNTEMFSLLLIRTYLESRTFLPLTPPQRRNWEGTQLGQPAPWDLPFHMVWCSAYKTEE